MSAEQRSWDVCEIGLDNLFKRKHDTALIEQQSLASRLMIKGFYQKN
jgi:hypothetical protein